MNNKPLSLAVSLILAALSSTHANALDMKWVCGSGTWSDASCWSTVFPPYQTNLPTNGDTVYLTQTDSITRTIDYVNTVSPNPVFYQLRVDATGSGTMTLTQATGSLNVSFDEEIGAYGKGSYVQSGGTNTVQSGLYLGSFSGSNGSYTLSGTGSLSVGWTEFVGGSFGTGTFTQTGGTNTTGTLSLGYVNPGSQGTYNLNGGTLTANQIYKYGNSSFNFNAGTLNIIGGSPAYIGGNGSQSFVSTINLDASKAFNVTNQLTINAGGVINSTGGTFTAGNVYSNGTITQSSGTTTIINALYLATSNGGTGTYNLNGGTLTVGSIQSDSSGGAFNFNAGTLNAANLAVGGTSPLGNTLNISANKVVSISNSLIINPGSTLSMQGGALTVGGVATNGLVNFKQIGGVTTVNGVLNSSVVDLQGGTLNGSGSIVGNVVNSGGTLAMLSSPGSMNIGGDYTQTSAGLFDVVLGFNSPTTLNIGGTASLHGTLTVSFTYPNSNFGIYPHLGDSFTLLSAANLVGSFDILNLASLGPNLAWNVDYLFNQDSLGTDIVRLSVVAVPEPESYAMILAGLGLVGAVARRRKQTQA